VSAPPMDDITSFVLSWVVGVVTGFFISIPVGPINVTIINEGARRGFVWALLIGFGAVNMEVIYCAIGFAGLGTFSQSKVIKASFELISFILMLFLGIKYLLARSLPATSKSAEVFEEKLHPHSAYMIGFVRVLGNPAVLLFWVTIAAAFVSHNWVDETLFGKGLFILGVGTGATAWFVLLSYAVARSHRHFSTNTLLKMSHISGACLVLVALFIGVRIVHLLARG
jgi:threonine/homoserine/homoserine lactone efflux protein